MICFAIFMAYLWPQAEDKRWLIGIFSLQWILNLAWNPIFFYFRLTLPALLVIVLLTVIIGYFLFANRQQMGWYVILVAPYFIWLLIASSLNAYVVFNN
jgi:tryptophan-rich sensory protein